MAASGVGELGSDNDPDAVAPGGAGSPGDAVAEAGATDKAEGTGDIAETSQLIVTGETAGGGSLTISGTLGGRIKHASSPPFGTDDNLSGFDFPFKGATVSNGIFDVAIASRFTAPIQAGSFTVTATEQPFGVGVLTGTGFLTSDNEFVIYELTDQADSPQGAGLVGRADDDVPDERRHLLQLPPRFRDGLGRPLRLQVDERQASPRSISTRPRPTPRSSRTRAGRPPRSAPSGRSLAASTGPWLRRNR